MMMMKMELLMEKAARQMTPVTIFADGVQRKSIAIDSTSRRLIAATAAGLKGSCCVSGHLFPASQ